MPSKKRINPVATASASKVSEPIITVQHSSPHISTPSTPLTSPPPEQKKPRTDRPLVKSKLPPKSRRRGPLNNTWLDFPVFNDTTDKVPVKKAAPIRMPKGSSSTAVVSPSEGGSSQLTWVNDQTPARGSAKHGLPTLDSDSDSDSDFDRFCSFDALVAAFDARQSPRQRIESSLSPPPPEEIFIPTRLPGL